MKSEVGYFVCSEGDNVMVKFSGLKCWGQPGVKLVPSWVLVGPGSTASMSQLECRNRFRIRQSTRWMNFREVQTQHLAFLYFVGLWVFLIVVKHNKIYHFDHLKCTVQWYIHIVVKQISRTPLFILRNWSFAPWKQLSTFPTLQPLVITVLLCFCELAALGASSK